MKNYEQESKMKRFFIGFIFISVVIGFSGCSTMQENARYSQMAKEHDFEYYFPSPAFSVQFDNPEEAYDYVRAAQAKFSSVSGKNLGKVLAAKLTGSGISADSVLLTCILYANSANNSIDLTAPGISVENEVRRAASSIVRFIIFYGDRGIHMMDFYLGSGYGYPPGYGQFSEIEAGGAVYKLEYPTGWNTDQAFKYLRKEIN